MLLSALIRLPGKEEERESESYNAVSELWLTVQVILHLAGMSPTLCLKKQSCCFTRF